MTRDEAIAKLKNDEAIKYEGARIVREGMDWCITHANGAFESFPESGAHCVSATHVIDRMDLIEFLNDCDGPSLPMGAQV